MKKININGIDFEVVNGAAGRDFIQSTVNRSSLKKITDIYNRPSKEKINIFYNWIKWFDQINKLEGQIGVTGGNCHTYSIGGWYTTNAGRVYLYITKSHNKAVIF